MLVDAGPNLDRFQATTMVGFELTLADFGPIFERGRNRAKFGRLQAKSGPFRAICGRNLPKSCRIWLCPAFNVGRIHLVEPGPQRRPNSAQICVDSGRNVLSIELGGLGPIVSKFGSMSGSSRVRPHSSDFDWAWPDLGKRVCMHSKTNSTTLVPERSLKNMADDQRPRTHRRTSQPTTQTTEGCDRQGLDALYCVCARVRHRQRRTGSLQRAGEHRPPNASLPTIIPTRLGPACSLRRPIGARAAPELPL